MVRGKGFSGFRAEVLSRSASEERRLLTQTTAFRIIYGSTQAA